MDLKRLISIEIKMEKAKSIEFLQNKINELNGTTIDDIEYYKSVYDKYVLRRKEVNNMEYADTMTNNMAHSNDYGCNSISAEYIGARYNGTTTPYINMTIRDARSFENIRILSENKVVEVTFADGVKKKMICQDERDFSLEFALYLALAKRLYSDKYTSEGVYKKALDMKYEKYFVKLVHDGLKLYKNIQIEKQKEAKRAEEEKQRIIKKREKKIAYKKRRDEKRKAEQVNVMVQAMKIAKEIEQ